MNAQPTPPAKPKRFRPVRTLIWLVAIYAVGAYTWPHYLRPRVEPHVEPARVWAVEQLGGTPTPPPPTGEAELKKTYLARLRIEVERPDSSVAAFVYVEERLIGPADRVHEVTVTGDAKTYRVRVVGLNGREVAPFSMREAVVAATPGQLTPVRLSVPSGSWVRTPSPPDCSPYTSSAYDIKTRVDTFRAIRTGYADKLQQLQGDLFWKQLAKTYDAFVANPPTLSRTFGRDVPVWVESGGDAKAATVDLELRPEQVRAAGDWLARKYDLTVMVGALEQIASSLRTMSNAAVNFRDQDSLNAVNGEFAQVNAMLAQNKPFVAGFGTTCQNLAQLLDEADRGP